MEWLHAPGLTCVLEVGPWVAPQSLGSGGSDPGAQEREVRPGRSGRVGPVGDIRVPPGQRAAARRNAEPSGHTHPTPPSGPKKLGGNTDSRHPAPAGEKLSLVWEIPRRRESGRRSSCCHVNGANELGVGAGPPQREPAGGANARDPQRPRGWAPAGGQSPNRPHRSGGEPERSPGGGACPVT